MKSEASNPNDGKRRPLKLSGVMRVVPFESAAEGDDTPEARTARYQREFAELVGERLISEFRNLSPHEQEQALRELLVQLKAEVAKRLANASQPEKL